MEYRDFYAQIVKKQEELEKRKGIEAVILWLIKLSNNFLKQADLQRGAFLTIVQEGESGLDFSSWCEETIEKLEYKLLAQQNQYLYLCPTFNQALNFQILDDLKIHFDYLKQMQDSFQEGLQNSINKEACIRSRLTFYEGKLLERYSNGRVENILTKFKSKGAEIALSGFKFNQDAFEHLLNEYSNSFELVPNNDFVIIRYLILAAITEGAAIAEFSQRLHQELEKMGIDWNEKFISKPGINKNISYDFNNFLVQDENGLSEKLKNAYRGSKPEGFAIMLFALDKLSYLNPKLAQVNKTHLHKALKTTFGSVGKRQNLNYHMNKYSEKPLEYNKKIQIEKEKIRNL